MKGNLGALENRRQSQNQLKWKKLQRSSVPTSRLGCADGKLMNQVVMVFLFVAKQRSQEDLIVQSI